MREFDLQESILALSAQVASVKADVKKLVKQFEDVHEKRVSSKERERENEKGRRRGKSPHTGHDKQARSDEERERVQGVDEHLARELRLRNEREREKEKGRRKGKSAHTGHVKQARSDAQESNTNQPESNAARQGEQLAFERAIHASAVLPWVGVVPGGLISPLTAAPVLVFGETECASQRGEASTVQDVVNSFNLPVVKDRPRRSSLPPPVM